MPPQAPLACPFIIFMHLAFLHLLPLCLLLRLRRNDFSMLRFDLSFLKIPQAGASYDSPFPFFVPALLPLASMPAVSLVGLVDTPTHALPPLPSPFTMGNTTCTSFRMPFLFCPAQPVSCLQVTVRSQPKPRARSTSFLLCGSGSRSGSPSGSRVRDSETFNSAD